MLLCLSSTDKPWSVIRCHTAAEGIVLGRFSYSPEVPALEHHSTPGLLSRRHCRLQLRSDGLITVEDLKSLNGTWVEGLSKPADGQQVVQQGAVQLEPFVPHVLQAGESLMLGGKDTVQGVGRSRVPNPFKFLFTPAVPSAAAGTVGAGAQAAAAATGTAVQQQHQREASGAGAVHTSMHHSQQQQDKPTASLDHTVKRSALQDAVTSNIQQQQQQLPGSSSQQAATAAMQAAVTDMAHYQPRTTSVVGVVEPATKRRRLPASAADAKPVSRQLESPPVQPLPEETTPAAELAERPGLVAAAGAAGAESSRQPSASRKRSIAQLQHMAGPHRPAAPAAANPVIEAAQGADAAAAAAARSDDALILGTTPSAEAAARRGPETAAAGSDSIMQSMASSRQHGTAQRQHTPRQHHTAVPASTGTANTPLVDPAIETAQAATAAAAAAAAAAATGSDEAIIIASDDSDFLLPRHGRRLRSTPQRAAAAAAARRAAVAAGSADTDAAAAGSCPAPGGAAVHAAAAGCADLPAAAANITSPAAAARTTPMRGQLVGAPDAAAATPAVARRSPRIQQQQQRPPSSSSKDVRKISISNLECGICKMLLVGPHVLCCGHHYCGMCLAQWLQAHSPPTCPCCRATVQSAPVHTFVLVQLVAEAMAKSGSEEQDFALRQETWDAIKEDTTAQWQEMFSRGRGGRGHEAPQNQPARPAAAAAGRGGSRGRRGAGRTQQQQQRPQQQQQRAVERVQLGTGDMHLLNGLMMPAGPMAGAAAAAAAGGGGVGMRAAGSARGPARAAAGAAAGARGRPQQGRGRQRGRNRQRQQQQQQLFQQQQQALAAAAAAAAAARTAAMQAPAPSRPRAAGAAARPAAQRHATAGRNGGVLQGPNAADRQLRQMGIDAFIR